MPTFKLNLEVAADTGGLHFSTAIDRRLDELDSGLSNFKPHLLTVLNVRTSTQVHFMNETNGPTAS